MAKYALKNNRISAKICSKKIKCNKYVVKLNIYFIRVYIIMNTKQVIEII
jgi:hypothetical protein